MGDYADIVKKVAAILKEDPDQIRSLSKYNDRGFVVQAVMALMSMDMEDELGYLPDEALEEIAEEVVNELGFDFDHDSGDRRTDINLLRSSKEGDDDQEDSSDWWKETLAKRNARTIIDGLSLRRRTPNIRAMRVLLPALRGENGPEALETAIEELKRLTQEPRILGLIDDLRGVNGPEKAHEAWGTLLNQIGGTAAQHKAAFGNLGESDSGWQPLKYFKGKVPYPEMYDEMEKFELEHGMSRFKRLENDEIKDIYLANDFKGWIYLFRYDQEKWEPHYDERRAVDKSLEDDSFL
jgi:hypothetical protein